jgi:hypothetical protein
MAAGRWDSSFDFEPFYVLAEAFPLGLFFGTNLPAMRISEGRDHAEKCMRLFLRMSTMPSPAKAERS